MTTPRFATLLLVAGLLAGCTDAPLTSMDEAPAPTLSRTAEGDVASLVRNPQLLEAAYVAPAKRGDVAAKGKGKGNQDTGGSTYVEPDLLAIVDFNTYEADGVTRRILDEYGVTRRILDEYGITRRVLEEYGITRRVLEEYGITRRVLEEYGITRRILDDYGVTRRILDEYGISVEEFDASFNEYLGDITLRVRNDGSISVRIKGEKVTTILLEMGDDPDIEFVEPDPAAQMSDLGTSTMRNNDDQFISYGIDRIAARAASADLSGVHVYVLDSGIYKQQDLKVETQKDFTMLFTNRDQETWDESGYVEQPYFDPGHAGNPSDEHGHGTHVAGTIGAVDNRTGVLGVAPMVKLHSLKVLTAEGRSDVTTIVSALNYVMYQRQYVHLPGEQVLVNLSLGMDIGSTQYNILDETVQKAIDLGIVVVVSAGNDAADASTYSPAHVREAITVAAYDHRDRFSERWSNYGEVVDLLAPGHEIVSLPHQRSDVQKNWRIIMSGTSMAAPHVTGAAAVYMAQHPNATPQEVADALKSNATGGISGVPSGTTDRTVDMEFLRIEAQDRPLRLGSASWDSKTSALELKGEGSKGAAVVARNADTGEELGSVRVHTDAKFYLDIVNPSAVPCRVQVESGSEQSEMAVMYAPADCEDGSGPVASPTPVVISKAEYGTNKQLKIEGSGPAGLTHTIRDQDGNVVASPTADAYGSWKYQVRKPRKVPCSVTVEGGGNTDSADVSGVCGS